MGWMTLGKIGLGVGGSVLGNWLGGKSAKSAMQRTPEELEALRGGQGAARGLAGQGSMLTQTGMPGIRGASDYWSTLLHGNRAAMSQATAAPRGAITDQYRGAERGLERSGVRGGVRDLAMAELSRDRAGKIAGLTTGVQPAAAANLAQLGTTLTGQGTAAQIGGGNIWADLLRAGTQNRMLGQEAGNRTSAAFGGGIWDLLAGTGSGSGTSTSSTGGGKWGWLKKLFGWLPGLGGRGDRSPDESWDPWFGYSGIGHDTDPRHD